MLTWFQSYNKKICLTIVVIDFLQLLSKTQLNLKIWNCYWPKTFDNFFLLVFLQKTSCDFCRECAKRILDYISLKLWKIHWDMNDQNTIFGIYKFIKNVLYHAGFPIDEFSVASEFCFFTIMFLLFCFI